MVEAAPQVGHNESITIEHPGFHRDEVLQIEASTRYDAAKQFGETMKDITQGTLEDELAAARKKGMEDNILETAKAALHHFEKLSEEGAFTVNGVNYGERYLTQLRGFAEGSGNIPIEKIAFMQMELDTGCQTLLFQDKQTKNIHVVHTEENVTDMELQALNRRIDRRNAKNPEKYKRQERLRARSSNQYNYRHATVQEGEDSYTFLAYPGLAAAGPAIGVHEQTLVAVDTLFTDQEGIDETQSVWVNAVASMLFDAGDIQRARDLVRTMREHKVQFSGGYAIHMAQTGNTPELTSFEFGRSVAQEIKPQELPDRYIVGQPNLSRTKRLYRKDEMNPLHPSLHGEEADPQNQQWSVEMRRRERRLRLMATLAQLPKDQSSKETIAYLERLAANPYGDVEHFGTASKRTDDLTGLPSLWTAAYGVGVIDTKGVHLRLGKLRPPKLEDKTIHHTDGSETYIKRGYALTASKLPENRHARADLEAMAQAEFDGNTPVLVGQAKPSEE